MIKYGLIADKAFFYDLIENAVALKSRDPDVLASVIARCCAIKADVVSSDEREGGVRAFSILATPLAMPLRRSRALVNGYMARRCGRYGYGDAHFVSEGMFPATCWTIF